MDTSDEESLGLTKGKRLLPRMEKVYRIESQQATKGGERQREKGRE